MVSKRISLSQLETLIEYMERNGDLSKPSHGLLGRQTSWQRWRNLSAILNSDRSGSRKTAEKWKKVWADAKSKAKKKATAILNYGSTRSDLHLNPTEDRILSLMAPWSNVEKEAEIEVDQDFEPLLLDDGDEILHLSTHEDPEPSPEPSPLPDTKRSLKSHNTSLKTRLQTPPQSSPQAPSLEESPTTVSNATRHRFRRRENMTSNRITKSFIETQRKRLKLDIVKEENYHRRELRRLDLEQKKNENFDRLLQLMEQSLPHLINFCKKKTS